MPNQYLNGGHLKNKRLFAIAFTVVFVLSFLEAHFVSLGAANMIPGPPSPINDVPIIAIQSPVSGNTYTDNVTMSFDVTKPDSWFYGVSTVEIVGWVSKIEYKVDGNTTVIYSNSADFYDGLANKTNFSAVLNELSEGTHSVGIKVNATTIYNPSRVPYSSPSFNYLTASTAVYFNIIISPKTSPTPSETPLSTPKIELNISSPPSPSQCLTAPPSKTQDFLQEAVYGIVLVAVIAVVAAVALIVRKRQKDTEKA